MFVRPLMYETSDKLSRGMCMPNLFIFTVAAFNVLGTREESDIIRQLYTYYNTP